MNIDIAPEEAEPEVKRGCWEDDKEATLKVCDVTGGVKMETNPLKLIDMPESDISSATHDHNPACKSYTTGSGSADSNEQEDLEASPSPLQSTPHSGITLALDNTELWNKFSVVATEMIITKSGRYMLATHFCIKNDLLDECFQHSV